MKVQIVNKSAYPTPAYATEKSAGVDLKANIIEPVTLGPLERAMIPTGLFLALPDGTEAQVRPRSGLAAKFGISVLNSPGTIDADYRGEVKVILVNLSNEPFVVNPGERIAQMVVARYEKVEWDEVEMKLNEARAASAAPAARRRYCALYMKSYFLCTTHIENEALIMKINSGCTQKP